MEPRPEGTTTAEYENESFFTPTPVPPDSPEVDADPVRRPSPLAWIADPALYDELCDYADHFDASMPTEPGLSFPMFCLRRFAPYPLHRLTPLQCLHFVDNLWTHLMPEIPWSWSQLFLAQLSGDTAPSAHWFLDRLVDCARKDARNPEVPKAPAAWDIGACRERGCSKSTQDDFVFVTNRSRVWFCMVSDGVSRSNIGSGEDASLLVEQALINHRTSLEQQLECLNCELPEKIWRAQAEKTLGLVGHWINSDLISEIRRRHPGPIQPGDEVMSVTSTMVLLRGNWCVTAQCGDSAAFLFQDGLMMQVTQEHSVRFANILFSLTGQDQFQERNNDVIRLLPNAANTSSVQVLIPAIRNLFTFSHLNLSTHSRLLVCTDGLLSRELPRRVVLNQILRKTPPGLHAQQAAEWILERASAQDCEDNMGLCWIAPAI
jgi:serine/threonine protein phosphatase PrpC